jgi:hypothetical protein
MDLVHSRLDTAAMSAAVTATGKRNPASNAVGMIASRATATLRKAQYDDCLGKGVLCRRLQLNVHDTEFPLPHGQQLADVEELLLSMQAKLSQWLGSRATPEAIELFPVNCCLACSRIRAAGRRAHAAYPRQRRHDPRRRPKGDDC